MKKKINLSCMVLVAMAIVATLLLSLAVSYDMLRSQVESEIRAYAYLIAGISEKENVSWADFDTDELRITVVNEDGTVLYDNRADAAEMGNHAYREEIMEALSDGEGEAVRKSDTLSENLFYCAVRTTDGEIVRVAKQASNIWGLLSRMLPMVACLVALLFAVCAALSRWVTRRVIAPIDKMAQHMDDLQLVDVYEELQPFVNTISKQHEDILKAASMRQEFTANVSHELKTPLTSISGYAQLMENNLVDADNIVNFAKSIHQNADRLLTLINDIIRLSELDDGQATQQEAEEVDLYAVAQGCVSMLEVSAEQHGVHIYAQGTEQRIRGNRQMLEELVYNLCDNAIRYNKKGGEVEVNVLRTREGAQLTVRDNGIGIPKEHQERIFERFYRVDKSRSKATGGTGLGLAIVKHIAQVHRATLEVVSEVDQGTKIIVTFPWNA